MNTPQDTTLCEIGMPTNTPQFRHVAVPKFQTEQRPHMHPHHCSPDSSNSHKETLFSVVATSRAVRGHGISHASLIFPISIPAMPPKELCVAFILHFLLFIALVALSPENALNTIGSSSGIA